MARTLAVWQLGLIVLVVVVVASLATIAVGGVMFRSDFDAGAQEILLSSVQQRNVVTEADIEHVPESVQRYLRYTGVVGRERVSTVRLEQRGMLRQSMDEPWKSITAVEYFSITPPAFVWMGQATVGPLSIVSARDSYVDERGRMLIRMLGIKTIGDVQGEEMDHSSLVRYLNEMMWFPTAYLNDNIHWEAIDNNSAAVTITDGDRSASGTVYFDEKGAMTSFVSERYHEVDGAYVRDTWETPMTHYRELNGLKLPVRGQALWRMSSGDFCYIDLEITALEFNVAEP